MNNLFSAGPKVSNTALADALKGFEVRATDLSEERKPRQIRRGGGLYGRPKGTSSPASSGVTKGDIAIEDKNTSPNVSSAHSSLDKYPEGNIVLSKLFGDKEKLLLSLNELQKNMRGLSAHSFSKKSEVLVGSRDHTFHCASLSVLGIALHFAFSAGQDGSSTASRMRRKFFLTSCRVIAKHRKIARRQHALCA